jgi:hypothetical protein
MKLTTLMDDSEKRDARANNSLCNGGFYLALNQHNSAQLVSTTALDCHGTHQ